MYLGFGLTRARDKLRTVNLHKTRATSDMSGCWTLFVRLQPSITQHLSSVAIAFICQHRDKPPSCGWDETSHFDWPNGKSWIVGKLTV